MSEPGIHVEGSKYFARAWNPEQAFPEDQDTFWGNAALRPLLIDTQANTTAPFPDLEGKFGIDGVTREVDGVSYFQVSETSDVEGGNTDVVELHPEGVTPKFHLDGFLLALERLH